MKPWDRAIIVVVYTVIWGAIVLGGGELTMENGIACESCVREPKGK
jgi:hypothetical protein